MDEILQRAREEIQSIDKEMATLFEKRMSAVSDIARRKKELGLPIQDTEREAFLRGQNAKYISADEIRAYYLDFLDDTMKISKKYQKNLLGEEKNEEKVIFKRGGLEKIGEYFDLDRKIHIITDTGVPKKYLETASKNCKKYIITELKAGEENKNFATLQTLIEKTAEADFTRGDAIVALGGGVVGDIAGLAAAIYMRGIDFYNIPTTVLSQADAAIGGKTAVDVNGIKNLAGAFYPAKKVLIDTDLVRTLPQRQISNGLAEIIKTALIYDADLFELIEKCDFEKELGTLICRTAKIKMQITSLDEKERGVRRILNFGHTLGHGIESATGFSELLHGECVGLGMIPMCAPDVQSRLIPVLLRAGLPTSADFDIDAALSAVMHDKKTYGEKIKLTFVEKIGSFVSKEMTPNELEPLFSLIKKGEKQK